MPLVPQAVACDLDGTLLRSDGTLGERTRSALEAVRAAGLLFALCTARPVRWVRWLAPLTDVAVCANGAVVWSPTLDEIEEVTALSPAAARTLVDRVNETLPGGAWAVEYVERYAHEPRYVPRWPVPDDTVVDDVHSLLCEPVVKLLFRDTDGGMLADELLARVAPLAGDGVHVTHSNSGDSLLEISDPAATKAAALERLCAARGIPAGNVIAFGDMPNDLPMLHWAGRGVAVANAHPDVLAAADEVTAANDEEGVARVLERVLAYQATSSSM